MRCSVKYSELYSQLLGTILVPLVLAAIFVAIMFVLRWSAASETILNVYTLAGSVALVLAGIFLIRKLVLIDAEVEYDLNGIHFQLKETSFLYKISSISIFYDNIQHLSFGDNDNYRVFIKIKTKFPKKMIFVSPDKYENNDAFIAYWNGIEEKLKTNTNN